MIKLKELFPDYILKGAIFETMGSMFNLPWKGVYDNIDIDIDYLSTFGERGASRLVIDCLEKYQGRVLNDNETLVVDDVNRYVISNQGIYQIAKIINRRFGISWKKLYDTMSLQYNPIENYSMVETEEIEGTGTETNEGSSANSFEGSNSRTIENSNSETDSKSDTRTINQTGTGTGTSESGVYGFNSSSSVPTATGENENSTTLNGTENSTGSNSIEGTFDSSESGSNSSTNNITSNNNSNTSKQEKRELKRSGNIGVTTSQQMIESERELWLYDYFKIIYQQLNSILTIPYYEC